MARVVLESEKELEDWIVSRLENGPCPFSRNDDLPSLVFRQLSLGPYGIADIVAIYFSERVYEDKTHRYCDINVIEVKKEAIGASTYSQVARYMTGMRHALESAGIDDHVELAGTIIGTEWSGDDAFLVEWVNIEAYIACFDMESGLSLQHNNGWRKTDEPTSGCGESLPGLISRIEKHFDLPTEKKLKVIE